MGARAAPGDHPSTPVPRLAAAAKKAELLKGFNADQEEKTDAFGNIIKDEQKKDDKKKLSGKEKRKLKKKKKKGEDEDDDGW